MGITIVKEEKENVHPVKGTNHTCERQTLVLFETKADDYLQILMSLTNSSFDVFGQHCFGESIPLC